MAGTISRFQSRPSRCASNDRRRRPRKPDVPVAAVRHSALDEEAGRLDHVEHDGACFVQSSVRLASQGGSVDWFRFWLQGYEDPDPSKAEQYARWRGLRKLQEENEAKEHAAKRENGAPKD